MYRRPVFFVVHGCDTMHRVPNPLLRALLPATLCTAAAMGYFHEETAPLMSETANNFLASLTSDQSSKARFTFADDERFNWHYIPKERKGLPIREMSPYQRHLASALLSSALSQKGYIKATTIMSLEDVLKMLEKDSGE